jgi:transposase-like protein
MRYSATEKLEIIQLVERARLPGKQTLDKLGISRTTFYRWSATVRALLATPFRFAHNPDIRAL